MSAILIFSLLLNPIMYIENMRIQLLIKNAVHKLVIVCDEDKILQTNRDISNICVQGNITSFKYDFISIIGD